MPAFHRFTVCLAALFVLTCTAAFAQATIHVPADQPTIQAGINAAHNGDTVLVAPGTYHENIDFKGKAITVTSSGGSAKTTIDGGSNGPAVSFITTEPRTAILSSFTIQHGGNFESFTGTNVFAAGGVLVIGSSPTILNNIITQNNCWGIQALGAAPLIQGNDISSTQDPKASCSFGGGAGIYIGGDINTFPTPPPHTGSAIVLGNTIENNVESGLETAGGNGGAGIAVWGGSPLIQSNIIRNNATADGNGGGINIESGLGVTIVQNLIYGNRAGCGGGAMAISPNLLYGYVALIVANNTMVDNIDNGGGGSSQCINISQIYPWPGTYGESGPATLLVNNIISGSTLYPAVNCGQYEFRSEFVQPIFDHNILYNAGGQFFGSYCIDVSAKYGNIAADPQFVDPANGNYHLKPTSPGIDAGNNSILQSIQSFTGSNLALDLDNNPRLQDVTGKGYPIIDTGAYEYTGNADASPTTIVLTPSSYTGDAGFTYVLTATFASALGVPTGSATFFLDGQQIGVSPIGSNGIATLTNFLMPAGVHSIYVSYGGQGTFTPATSVVVIVKINLYTVTLNIASSANPSILGQNVTFTITTSTVDKSYIPSPIKLVDNSTNTTLATLTPDSSGVATFTTSSLALGNHNIVASYAGDSAHNPASAGVTQQVVSGYPTSISLVGSPNPSISGQNVTFTATVTSTNGTPTGSVQFTDNGTSIGTQTLNASGVATFSTSTLSVGTHTIAATYIPTGSFAGTSTSITQTVNDITDAINLTSSLNPSTYGQPVTITAHVVSLSGLVLTGSVTFSEGSQFLGTQTVGAFGNAAITLSTLSVGAHIITGAFTPTGSSHTFAGTLTQQVNGLPTSTLLTATPLTGVAHITPITLAAMVAPATPGTPTPTGQVLFYVNGAQLNLATLVNGVATFTGTLPAGIDQIYAAYVGDPNHIYSSSNSNTVAVTITAAPSTLSLISSLNPAPALTPFTVSAQLGIPGGPQPGAGYPISITIAPTTTVQPATNASGTATYTSTGLLPGQYLVTATFAGTTDLQPSTATSFLETITANPTATTLTASPNPGIQNNPVTFTSTVSALAGSASPSGTVTIYDSLSPSTAFTPITTLAIPSAAGTTTATFTTSALTPGTHILYAAFTPAAGFAPSQSAQFTLIIEPQSFTLTLSDPTLTVQTGHHRTETATLTSIGGLTGTFTLSCGTLPLYASCGWVQGSVTLPANGTVSTSLTIDSDQLLDFLASNTRPTPNAGAGTPFMARFMRHEWAATTAFTLFPLTLLGFRRRRNLRALLPLLILAALASTLTACGANQYPYSTTPGTYTVRITAAGPPVPGRLSPTQTVDLTLVVTR